MDEMNLESKGTQSVSPCDCNKFLGRVEALIDRQVEDLEAQILHEHAKQCPMCANAEIAEVHLRTLIRECGSTTNARMPRQLRAKILLSIHRATVMKIEDCDEQGG